MKGGPSLAISSNNPFFDILLPPGGSVPALKGVKKYGGKKFFFNSLPPSPQAPTTPQKNLIVICVIRS